MIQPDDPRAALEALEQEMREWHDHNPEAESILEWADTVQSVVKALASSDPPAVRQSIEKKEDARVDGRTTSPLPVTTAATD